MISHAIALSARRRDQISQNSTSVSVTGMPRSTPNESRGASFIPCLFFSLSALRASYGKLRFPESSPFGGRPFKRIGFQLTRFELTTDRFSRATIRISAEAIRIKTGQRRLLCSPYVLVFNKIIRRRRGDYCRIIPETRSRGLFDIITHPLISARSHWLLYVTCWTVITQ